MKREIVESLTALLDKLRSEADREANEEMDEKHRKFNEGHRIIELENSNSLRRLAVSFESIAESLKFLRIK